MLLLVAEGDLINYFSIHFQVTIMSLRFFIDSPLVIQGIHRKIEPLWRREAFYQASYDRLSSMENTTACKETGGGFGNAHRL